MRQAKKELLEHYEERNPKLFHQYDGHDVGGGDDVMHPDEDGHCIMSSDTYELMYAADVRVLISPGTTRETTVTLLNKIKDFIQSNDYWDKKTLKTREKEDKVNEVKKTISASISAGKCSLADIANYVSDMEMEQENAKCTQTECVDGFPF